MRPQLVYCNTLLHHCHQISSLQPFVLPDEFKHRFLELPRQEHFESLLVPLVKRILAGFQTRNHPLFLQLSHQKLELFPAIELDFFVAREDLLGNFAQKLPF